MPSSRRAAMPSVTTSWPRTRDAAGRRREQARDAADRRGLARAVRPEQAEDLPGLRGEGDVVHGDEIAVTLAELGDGNHWGRRLSGYRALQTKLAASFVLPLPE